MIHQFLYNASDLTLFIYFFVVGACIGSFVNVVNYRLPILIKNKKSKEADKKEYFFKSLSGRSKCPKCEQKIKDIYNLPILGWLILKGRSSCCNQKISKTYPIVEALFAFVFAGLILFIQEPYEAIALMFAFSSAFSLIYMVKKDKIISKRVALILFLSLIFFAF